MINPMFLRSKKLLPFHGLQQIGWSEIGLYYVISEERAATNSVIVCQEACNAFFVYLSLSV